jgi:hypothetical protein
MIFNGTLTVRTPLTVVMIVSVCLLGAVSVPAKEAVALPAILLTLALAGDQVSSEPALTASVGVTVKLLPTGAVQA